MRASWWLVVVCCVGAEGFLLPAQLGAAGVRPSSRRSAVQSLRAGKMYTSKEFNVNWNRPDAQGTFGRVRHEADLRM